VIIILVKVHLIGYVLIVVIAMILVFVMFFVFVFAVVLALLSLIVCFQLPDTKVERSRHQPEVAILGDVTRQRREFVAALQAPTAEANMREYQVLAGNLTHERDPFHDCFFGYWLTMY